ncbi:hypothetical protein ACWGST_15225 [Agromyces sp. NPDC055520]
MEKTHTGLAARLRRRVLETGVIDPALREGAMSLGAGGVASITEP